VLLGELEQEEEFDDPLAFRVLERVPLLGGPLQGLQWPHVHLQVYI